MNDPMLPLPGLSSASGKPVVVKFDGGLLSSDGGVLALREVEQRLRVADRLAACMIDPRAADQITHSLADVIRFRLLMISAGYEDGNDANALRRDPMFKMALDLSPIDRELCSQSTISRLENLPDVRAVLRMGRAMVDLYCESFATVPKRITRADSHYCGPEVLDWCRANGLDYILGIAPTATLRRHVEGLEASTKAKFEAAPRDGKLRRFMEFFDGAQSWSRVERIIARVEAGAEGPDTRNRRLQPRTAFLRFPPVHCADLEGKQRVEGGPSLSIQRSSQKGGKRAYEGRLKKDRSARQSRRSITSTKQPSPPFATFRLPAAMAAIRPVTPELPAARNDLSFFQALKQARRLGFHGVASHRAGEMLGVDEIRRRSDAVEFGRLASADDRVRSVGGPSIGR